MEKNKRGPNVDKKMFDLIKILIQSDTPYAEISEYTGVQKTTIARVRSAANWTEYCNILAAMALEQRQKKAAERKAKEAIKKEMEAKQKEQEAKQKQAFHNLEPSPEEKKQEQVVKEVRQNVTVQTTYYVSQKLDAMTELLKGISAKLACIIDDLYGTGKKEDNK